MDNFKINVVYELEKETSFQNTSYLRKKLSEKYDLKEDECSILNRMITNYQVQKYGSNLEGSFRIEKNIKRSDNIFKRKQRRK